MNLAEKLIVEIDKKQKRILIVGDAMVDRWVHGHIDVCQDGCPKFVEERLWRPLAVQLTHRRQSVSGGSIQHYAVRNGEHFL